MDSVSNKAKEKIDLVNEDKNLSSTVEDRKTEQGALRKLDVQVAERVMGWKHYQSRKELGLRLTFFLSPETYATHYIQSKNLVEVENGNEANAPRYSSDIAAAFAVVERMRANGWNLIMNDSSKPPPAWFVDFLRESKEYGEAGAETLPEAICRAALKATECLSRSDDTQPGQAS